MSMLKTSFFERDSCEAAQSLLGKIIRHKYKNQWLAAKIIETEAYYLNEKGSHASLGFTEKRKALFMPAGTIYMYYARGKDSLNISCHGDGNAVLIKSAYAIEDEHSSHNAIKTMLRLNPLPTGKFRTPEKLCSGQTLLCRALNIKLTQWDQKKFDSKKFYIDDTGYVPEKIIQTTRLGIPNGRDEHLPYRFIDYAYAKYCTNNPLSKRGWKENKHYKVIHL